ncbi:glycosyltransferase family 4 protein [Streptomyces sp. RB6PN25]|uniref:Glycosyltransferase family 4 protein n=1 Tax=Streptomyces humicola TaxID=2953240 RepID=A0ABT1Q8E7_9ACTN|nr:glycosyltransferase family 4 protein [Streptomyces humicola]MCQ4085057.1 glycosyltransferase family 4 protein [Streptomyces humicola]
MSSIQTPVPGPLRAVQVLGATAAAHVCSLAGGLAARGVEVTVCGPAEVMDAYGMCGTGARFAPVETAAPPGPRTDAMAVAALRSACAGADVVHAHGLRAGLLTSLALPRMRRPALVVTWHGGKQSGGARSAMTRLLERRVARTATVVLGASSDLVDRVRALGARDVRLAPLSFPAPRTEADRPAEDTERMHRKIREELGAADRPLIVAVGRLEPDQGHGLLLDAALRWRALDPQPLVAVAGEGRRRQALQRRIDAEELPVRLLGRRDDLADLLTAADLVVLAGRGGAHPLIAQEALYAGAPLVATASGGLPELVGEAAVLVPDKDADALAGAVASLIADPGRRERLSAAGRVQAASWPTEDDMVAQVLSVYDELASRRP